MFDRVVEFPHVVDIDLNRVEVFEVHHGVHSPSQVVCEWLEHNVGPALDLKGEGVWDVILSRRYGLSAFSFAHKRHALMFKLAWGGC